MASRGSRQWGFRRWWVSWVACAYAWSGSTWVQGGVDVGQAYQLTSQRLEGAQELWEDSALELEGFEFSLVDAAPALAGVEVGGVGPLCNEPVIGLGQHEGGFFTVSEWWAYWDRYVVERHVGLENAQLGVSPVLAGCEGVSQVHLL
jgi:hypothetical protein